MLGPDVFCWQSICNLYHILGAFVYHVKPKTFKDVELVINTFKSHKTSIDRYRYVHIYCDINELLGSYSYDLITRFSVSFEEGRCIKSIFCNIFILYYIRYQKFLAKPLAVYLMMFPGCLWLQPQLKLLLLSNGMWEHHRLSAFPVFSQASIILWMFP